MGIKQTEPANGKLRYLPMWRCIVQSIHKLQYTVHIGIPCNTKL